MHDILKCQRTFVCWSVMADRGWSLFVWALSKTQQESKIHQEYNIGVLNYIPELSTLKPVFLRDHPGGSRVIKAMRPPRWKSCDQNHETAQVEVVWLNSQDRPGGMHDLSYKTAQEDGVWLELGDCPGWSHMTARRKDPVRWKSCNYKGRSRETARVEVVSGILKALQRNCVAVIITHLPKNVHIQVL